MVVPDYLLAHNMEILVFVDRDAPLFLDQIPVYMFGLWVIPINIIVWGGMTIEELEGPVARIHRYCIPLWHPPLDP